MKNYKQEFLTLATNKNILKFGEFTLKSGRISPYFFNAGLFSSGKEIYHIADNYAQAILEYEFEFDVLFGPAYKGIPLASCVAAILFHKYNKNIEFAYNRKEKKTHGEGGVTVGASLEGKKVLIIDDVITAGTAIRDSFKILKLSKAKISGVILALNRQEKVNDSDLSAVQQISQDYNCPVRSIINLDDIISFVACDKRESLENYRKIYGVF